jgi:hypothetical protein
MNIRDGSFEHELALINMV